MWSDIECESFIFLCFLFFPSILIEIIRKNRYNIDHQQKDKVLEKIGVVNEKQSDHNQHNDHVFMM